MPPTEQQLIAWSRPVSTTEDQKCKNAISQVTEAIRKKFGNSVSIFLQGSYKNNTNVKQDSDVDIVVRHDGYYFPNTVWLSEEQKAIYEAYHPNSQYSFVQFKNEVHQALIDYFGSAQKKDKCILVPGNSYRVNADTVPCFPLKRFTSPTNVDAIGIKFITDKGQHIESYPEQHYANGVSKNNATNRMYKRAVRMLKRIRNELIDDGSITENLVSSFFIECLVYNVPNSSFISEGYRGTLRSVIARVFNDMLESDKSDKYEEVSELKWLFRGLGRSPEDAKLFMDKCWTYAGFD